MVSVTNLPAVIFAGMWAYVIEEKEMLPVRPSQIPWKERMLMIVSACLLLIYLAFYLFRVYRRKEIVEPMKANMVSMIVGMVNGLLIGLVIGFYLQGHLALSTIWSILISLVLAFVIGKPFGEMAVIEASGAGLMGGLMGAMLGEMLPGSEWRQLLMFMNILYILSMSFMMQWLWIKGSGLNLKKTSAVLLSALLPIVIVSSFTFIDESVPKDTKMQNHQMQHEIQTNGFGGPLCTP